MVAKNENELCAGSMLWEAVQKWKRAAEEVDEQLYVYAHNGFKFDAVPIVHAAMLAKDEQVNEMLRCNGRFISFKLKSLIFQRQLSHCHSQSRKCIQSIWDRGQ